MTILAQITFSTGLFPPASLLPACCLFQGLSKTLPRLLSAFRISPSLHQTCLNLAPSLSLHRTRQPGRTTQYPPDTGHTVPPCCARKLPPAWTALCGTTASIQKVIQALALQTGQPSLPEGSGEHRWRPGPSQDPAKEAGGCGLGTI